MAETDVAAAITFANSTAVTITVGAANESDRGAQIFNPIFAYWIDDPIVLQGYPVTGSGARWTSQVTAPGSTLTVETSINNGASWDLAVNNRPIPRLNQGDTVTRQVLTRATYKRVNAADASPRLLTVDVEISCEKSTNELVPIGHGIIDKVSIKSTGGTGSGSGGSHAGGAGVTGSGGGHIGGTPSITIHGVDLSKAIARNTWQQPFFIPTGTNYADAARLMVGNRLPGQTEFSLSSCPTLTPLLVFGLGQGGDPWQDIREVATAVGFEAFFDPAGVFIFRPVPDPRTTPAVWVFDDADSLTVTEAKRTLADEQTYNYVTVLGQSTSSKEAVSGVAFDNDPSSTTYIYGAYGIRSISVTMSQVKTPEQAQVAANAILLNSLGAAETVEITTVPMPALEPGDVVIVRIGDVKADGTYLVNQMTTPLSQAEAQTLTCYRQSNQQQ